MTVFYDEQFVEIDLILRQGAHINRSNLAAYEFLSQNFADLEKFYRRYGCSLLQHPDGFFFMTVKGGLMRTRLLPKSCMHLGQFIGLKARDPEITRSHGRIAITQLLKDIETLVPRETLQAVYAPGRRDATADECISDEIMRALKLLGDLGFIEIADKAVRPLEAIGRFSELARHDNDPNDDAKLNVTIRRGVVFDSDTTISFEEEGNGNGDNQD